MISRLHGEKGSFWLALAVSALLSLPYLAAVQSFFTSDDWVHLTFTRAIPPWQVWRYFSPRVVWFYRPLQALQFGWLYHAVGLRPLVYNLCLLAMHLGVCLLVYILASSLTTWRTALLATALFAAQWAYVDVVLWPSNFSTLHWALVTLGLCILFLRYLECRRPAFLAGVYVLFLLNFCAKETAVDAPLLLGALWWWYSSGSARPLPLRARLREAAWTIGPFGVITIAYLGFHRCVVHDIYQGPTRPLYQFAPPAWVPRQTLFAINHLLLSFYRDPVVLPRLPPLQAAVRCFVEHILILPLLLGGVAWRCRDRVLGLGLLWILATLTPTICLTGFHTSRFYYLPAIGSALILAHGGRCGWRRMSALESPLRSLRLTLPIALAYLLLANLSLVTLLCLQDRDDSRLALSAFRVLGEAGRQLPRGSLIVMKNPPETAFANGLGVPEMVRIALRDPTAQAAVERQKMPAAWVQRLNQIRSVYVLDFARHPLALRSAWDAGRPLRRPDQTAPVRAARSLPPLLSPTASNARADIEMGLVHAMQRPAAPGTLWVPPHPNLPSSSRGLAASRLTLQLGH